MCISENNGGHHGRLAIPKTFKKRRLIAPDKIKSTTTPFSHERGFTHIVHHNYHDHIMDKRSSSFHEDKDLDKSHFPIKLHAILDHIEDDGFAHLISWQPHGRSFRVHKQDKFMKEILPEYFKLHRYASFQRQLNLYGFQRITKGLDKGSYYHELFLRGRPFLAHRMSRTRIKGTGVRPRSDPDSEPDFYNMPAVDTESPAPVKLSSSDEEEDVKVEAEDDTEEEDTDVERHLRTPSPSPAVVDTRTAKEKLHRAFPNETVSSNVIPYEATSSSVSDNLRSDADDDDLVMFEGKPFHYLNPYEVMEEQPTAPTLVPSYHHEHDREDDRTKDEDNLFTQAEMDAMIETLYKPGGIWSIDVNDMDDKTFGTILENLVISGGKYYI